MIIIMINKNHVTDLYYPHHPAFPFLAAAAAGLKHHDLSSRIINHYQVLGKSLAKKISYYQGLLEI